MSYAIVHIASSLWYNHTFELLHSDYHLLLHNGDGGRLLQLQQLTFIEMQLPFECILDGFLQTPPMTFALI